MEDGGWSRRQIFIRSSRREEALTGFHFPAFRFPLFSLSLLTSAATEFLRWRRFRQCEQRFRRHGDVTHAARFQNFEMLDRRVEELAVGV